MTNDTRIAELLEDVAAALAPIADMDADALAADVVKAVNAYQLAAHRKPVSLPRPRVVAVILPRSDAASRAADVRHHSADLAGVA